MFLNIEDVKCKKKTVCDIGCCSDSLRNVDARILSLSKSRLASPDEPTAPESDAMPLSTSSLLMTYGSTTFGTNTWGALQAAIQEGKAGTGIIDIEANDMRTLTVGDGLTSAESTTKGTMAQLLQQDRKSVV